MVRKKKLNRQTAAKIAGTTSRCNRRKTSLLRFLYFTWLMCWGHFSLSSVGTSLNMFLKFFPNLSNVSTPGKSLSRQLSRQLSR